MRNIKITIEYDGTCFHGWQIQDSSKHTIQGEIEKALKKIFKEKIRLIGSGRTDSGVHATGQVANFKTNSKMSTGEILKALNSNLPDGIVILKVQKEEPEFHAQYSAKRKTYRYTILNHDLPSVKERNFCYFYPYQLNINTMQQEAKHLIGRKDFKSFQASDPSNGERAKNTIRTIKRIKITKKNHFMHIDIAANGFLYKMVRNIVGALLEVGSGRLPIGSIKLILRKKNRIAAPKTAPARGLCLTEVKY